MTTNDDSLVDIVSHRLVAAAMDVIIHHNTVTWDVGNSKKEETSTVDVFRAVTNQNINAHRLEGVTVLEFPFALDPGLGGVVILEGPGKLSSARIPLHFRSRSGGIVILGGPGKLSSARIPLRFGSRSAGVVILGEPGRFYSTSATTGAKIAIMR